MIELEPDVTAERHVFALLWLPVLLTLAIVIVALAS